MCCNHHSRLAHLLVGAMALTFTARSAPAQIEFGIPKPMPEPFNVNGVYGYEYLSDDGLNIYFASNFENNESVAAFDMYSSHRASLSAPWEPFAKLPDTINSPERAEFAPSMTADGQQFYFMRADSPFGIANSDLFVSNKLPDGTWGEAQPLAFNTAGIEGLPTISPDGLTLYFNTLVNDAYPHPPELYWNMYVAHRNSLAEPFGDPEHFFGGYGTVTPDGLKHIFMGYGDVANYYGLPHVNDDADLYIRTRSSVDTPWGPPQFLKPPLNASGLDCCPFLSAADDKLYFVSIRPGTDSVGVVGFVDMWQAPLAKSVLLEINPGETSDSVDWNTQEVLTAAILSQPGFDAFAVDVATLRFGDPLLIADGASPVSPLAAASADVDGDGLLDLTIDFSISQMRSSGVAGRLTLEGYLAGALLDGSIIAGRDALAFVPEPTGLLLFFAGLALMPQRWRN